MANICAWPGCGRGPLTTDDYLISHWMLTDDLLWCRLHDSDDVLPDVIAGKSGKCVYCRASAVTWIDGPDGQAACCHERCRRLYLVKLLGTPPAPEIPTVAPVGAYARRHGVAR